MQTQALLTLARTAVASNISSRKQLLQRLSKLFLSIPEAQEPSLHEHDLFELLIARERLGSTSIGHGIALPHTRIAGLQHAYGAFLLCQPGIAFDAVDEQDVDVFFALLVPENAEQAHLQILADLARFFADKANVQNLRICTEAEQLYNNFQQLFGTPQ